MKRGLVGTEGNAPCSSEKELAGMGLKFQNSCNPLNTLLKNNHQRLSIVQSKDTSDFKKLQNSMERFVERCNRESIKNTMLKHEEIFQKQVHELHRLYQVQKMLMTELRSKDVKNMNSVVAAHKTHNVTDTKNKFQSCTSTSETTHSSHASVRNHCNAVPNTEHTSLHRFAAIAAGQSSQEISNCVEEPFRISEGHNLQKSVEGESPESCSNEGCNLDLTLSIGCTSNKKRKTDWKRITNDSIKLLPSDLNRTESGKECTNSSDGFGAESLKRPHWLVQALSLNRT